MECQGIPEQAALICSLDPLCFQQGYPPSVLSLTTGSRGAHSFLWRSSTRETSAESRHSRHDERQKSRAGNLLIPPCHMQPFSKQCVQLTPVKYPPPCQALTLNFLMGQGRCLVCPCPERVPQALTPLRGEAEELSCNTRAIFTACTFLSCPSRYCILRAWGQATHGLLYFCSFLPRHALQEIRVVLQPHSLLAGQSGLGADVIQRPETLVQTMC